MRVLWIAWKDFSHPEKGGAEVVLQELIVRQLAEGHKVTLLTAMYPGAPRHEYSNGLVIIRVGSNRYLHPFQALFYYLRHLRGKFDRIIETVNTAPYFILLFKGKAKGMALYHQLARDVWFFETKAPLSYLGYYIFEPLATWLLGRAKAPLITISESTKNDLAAFGWDPARTTVISEGIQLTPAKRLTNITKYAAPTMLSFGALRTMKRTLDQIKAFEIAKLSIPNLQLKIAGSAFGAYGRQVLDYIKHSKYAHDIHYLGRAKEAQKMELMQQSHVIVVTSVKEGWGLIVTEAASQGTPAVVYDVDGLRDSVRNNKTGVITYANPTDLAKGVVTLLEKPQAYESLRGAAWQWSKQMTFDQSYQDFKQVVEA